MQFNINNRLSFSVWFEAILDCKTCFKMQEIYELNKIYFFSEIERTKQVFFTYIYKSLVIREITRTSYAIITHLTNSSKV